MGTHAQLGNTDTMGDIISGTLGGLAAILVWAVARRPKSLLPPSLAGRDASDPPPHRAIRPARDADDLHPASTRSPPAADAAGRGGRRGWMT